MSRTMKTCRQCNQEFQIFDEDREFYTKINVPEPTWCPECRNMRRCAQRNERVLTMRSCDLCKKSTLSTHHADVPFPVYCQSCYWSDNWNAFSYGRDFDFSRSFFEQFTEFCDGIPHVSLMTKDMENSEWCSDSAELKDSYMSICSFVGERALYAYWLNRSEDIVDSNYILRSEVCYECQHVQKNYNCQYVYNSQNMTDSMFCFSCSDCINCFMCVNIKHKSYCIKNKQYTKEKYESLRTRIIEHMKKTGEYGEFFPIKHSPYGYNETVAQQWYPKTREEVLANGWKWRDELPGKYESRQLNGALFLTISKTRQRISSKISLRVRNARKIIASSNKSFRFIKPRQFRFRVSVPTADFTNDFHIAIRANSGVGSACVNWRTITTQDADAPLNLKHPTRRSASRLFFAVCATQLNSPDPCPRLCDSPLP